jgi:zinc transport system ATP-binding protein
MKKIQIENVNVSIGKNQILKDISLEITSKKLTTLIGKNGAGKSTLLKTLLGDMPYKGKITYSGLAGGKKPVIGYIPQKLLFDLSSPVSVLDVFAATQSKRPVWFGASSKRRREALEIFDAVGAGELLDRKLGVLSGGELQRVLLALALYPVPDILLLDEPVAGMDPNGMHLFYEKVEEISKVHDIAILLISHDLDLVADHADQVIFLHQGHILAKGAPSEVFDKEIVKKEFPTCKMHLKNKEEKEKAQEKESREEIHSCNCGMSS